MSTVRVVRPRPLGLTDRIPVFWPGNEPSQELKQIDSGALYRHLVAASTPAANRKRKRTEQYHAPKEGEAHEHFSPVRKAQEQQAKDVGPIAVPQVRNVQDYHLNQQAAAQHGPMIDGDIAAAPYLRHQQLLPGVYEENQPTEYSIDDEDVAWLNNINTKNGQGLFAAAVGLYRQMSQRISGGSEGSSLHAQELRLSVGDFERVMDALEQAHFAAVKAWWEEQQMGPSTSTPQVPKIPLMKSLLPRAAALDVVAAVVSDRKLAAQLLDYWLRKRQAEGGPLIPHLWFEQPWKLVAYSGLIDQEDEDFDEHLPFMAVEPRSAHKQRRTAPNRKRMSEEDAVEALYNMRNELEMLRTLADQVRKREKLKRQLLLLTQQELQMRQELGVPPAAPVPKTARLHQLARNNTGAGPAAGVPAAHKAESSAIAAAQAAAAAVAAPGRNHRPAAANAPLPTGRSAPDLSRIVAKAAAAVSPHEGERPRQTRTSAAAAAAAFELAVAAKRAKVEAEVGLASEEIRLVGQLAAHAAATAGTGQHAQEQQQLKDSAPQPLSNAASNRRSGITSSMAARGAGHSRSRKRQQEAAAAGDADDEMDESGDGAVQDRQHECDAAEAAEPPRRGRRYQSHQLPQHREQQQQRPLRQQQQQQVKRPGRRKQEGQQLAAAAAAVPVVEVSVLSSSSSESDNNGDADYMVSEEEGVTDSHIQQQASTKQQVRTRYPGTSRRTRATDRSNGDANVDADNNLKAPTKCRVALKRAQSQQLQPATRRRGIVSAAAQEGMAAAEAQASRPRRLNLSVKQHPNAVCQPQQTSRVPINKQRVQLKVKRNSSVSQAVPAVAVTASGSGASYSRQDNDSTSTERLMKQPRLAPGCRAALLASAAPSGPANGQLVADAAGCRIDAAVDKRVLRLHNHQQEQQLQPHRGVKQSGSQAQHPAAGPSQGGTAPEPAAAVPIPAKRGSNQVTRPVSGDTRGASVRRPARAADDSNSPLYSMAKHQRRAARAAVGRSELRSLGLSGGSDKKPRMIISRK